MQHWYVYYKQTPVERDGMREQVRRMQEQIARAGNARVRLLERTEQAGTITVMEVYEDIEDAAVFAHHFDTAVRAHLPEAHIAARRIERFRDV